ncbi:class I SAM-dependent methyltransferase [Rhodobacteraceae bacterium 2376]|uniref:Class I SAM-dependent methyltransferase n=1 Tax=Rhabdonatronobacter sediminivivens TaxID=2743469 RepID=A0A7Z0L0Z1_9RHOB|nr:class I SAM-dependent methyltransferase [Rhabdonatronobacter sediminivivens]NYS25583.1 class I SAM-dependent methyltransferase [Rhabdonatronobacter sediminivivens]
MSLTVPLSLSLTDPAQRHARLSRALEEGLALPCDGPIAVLRPRGNEDFTPLPQDRLHMVQGFRPDHDALQAAGYRTATTPEGRYAMALVCLPRAKTEARGLIAQAVALSDGPVLVDGQKLDGVDSILRELRKRVAVEGVTARAHGKLFWFTPGADDLADWAAVPQHLDAPDAPGFVTRPGVFSADGVDPASRLLAEHLPDTLGRRVVDLGAGWGYLAAQALQRKGLEALHLVEAEHDALDCARRNIDDPRAQFHWADALTFALPGPVDTVLCNPPFHTGRTPRPELGRGFIAAAARLLTPKGTLWLVANRHLPYDSEFTARFHAHTIEAQTPAFRIWRATAPRRTP